MRALICSAILLTACATPQRGMDRVRQELPLLGHRNWIAVVDMAYPAQIAAGVETVYVGGDQLERVREALAMVDSSPHVRARVLIDRELGSVAEADAPGIGAYRDALTGLLAGASVEHVPHEEIIARIDEAAATFRVLVIKTDMTLPYTSVFLELDCGYWSGDAESRLRAALGR